MKTIRILILLISLCIIFPGCKKDDENPYADMAVGVYNGSWLVLGKYYTGVCEVIKTASSTVDLEMEIIGTSIPTLPDVNLSDGGNGKIKLSYSDESGTLTGTIQNKTISFIIDDGDTEMSFTGTKK